jgi:hypothetical protein
MLIEYIVQVQTHSGMTALMSALVGGGLGIDPKSRIGQALTVICGVSAAIFIIASLLVLHSNQTVHTVKLP